MSKQTSTQVTLMILRAAKRLGVSASVKEEAILAEIVAAGTLGAVTQEEVEALVRLRCPVTDEELAVEKARAAALAEELRRAKQSLLAKGLGDEVTADETMAALLEGVELPSGKRLLLGFVAAFLTGCVIGYVGSMVLAWLLAGSLLLGAGGFLTMLVTVLTWVLVLIASYWTGGAVGTYIISQTIDRHCTAVWDTVSGWFSSDTPNVEGTPAGAAI